MSMPCIFTFTAGSTGDWRIDRIDAVCGETLALAPLLSMGQENVQQPRMSAAWMLRGVTSNLRYTHADERIELVNRQAGLGRSDARLAALIPIRKNAAWWQLAQDERRAIFETDSHHIAIGQQYLPAIARQLHHCRDLAEPFDFLTWFEYSPGDAAAFDDLVGRLRKTEEWRYVDREVDIRLVRDGTAL